MLALAGAQLQAQAWDPARKATGWARVDIDGSIAFHDPASRKIYSWLKDGGGVFSEVDVSKLPQAPEKWVMDASLNAWVVTGGNLRFVNKANGTFFSTELPHEVGDLAWDAVGMYFSYKNETSLIEKKSFQTGEVIWATELDPDKEHGSKGGADQILVTPDKTLVVSHPGRFQVDLVDGGDGRIKGQVTFSYRGKPAPACLPGRGAMGWWLDQGLAIRAIPASSLPSLGMVGLLLAKEDLAAATVDFVPTGLSEEHSFIGMVESEAVFIAPGGGLVYLPIHPK